MFSRDRRYGMNAERRIAAGNRTKGALAALVGRRNVSKIVRETVRSPEISAFPVELLPWQVPHGTGILRLPETVNLGENNYIYTFMHKINHRYSKEF